MMPRLAWLTHRSYQANIPKFFVFRFVWEFMLFLPIWVIFLQTAHGLSLTQITLIDLAFWLTVAVGEVPTGAVADAYGRKPSLIIGVLLLAAAISLFALAPTYPLLLLANALWALAFTFESGAALALFYDSLRQLERTEEYTHLRGRLTVVENISIAVSSALGGLLGALDLTLPFLVYAALVLASLGFVWRFHEPPRASDPATGQYLSYRQTLRRTTQALRQHAGLRYALLYSGMLPLAAAIVGTVFLQPHARALGVPIAAMGFLILGLRGVRMIGATASHHLVARFGELAWLRLAPVVICVGMLGLGVFNSLWGIALFALVGLATSATNPVIEAVILRQTPDPVRATILSVDSLLFRLLLAVTEPCLGLLGDAAGLQSAFLALAIGVGVSHLVVLVLWSREKKQSPRSLRRNSHRRKPPYRHFCTPRLRVFSPQIFQELLKEIDTPAVACMIPCTHGCPLIAWGTTDACGQSSCHRRGLRTPFAFP